ncbi:MAG: hypothetical protein WEB00_01700 [Dehalococcoidia bacterium]
MQLLITNAQYLTLRERAKITGASMGALVRQAISSYLECDEGRRREAANRILAAEPMQVGNPEELRAELEEMRARNL